MRAVYLCARSAQNVQRETKHSFSFFHIFSHLFHILFVPFSLLFVAKKQNTWKLWRISPELRHFSYTCDFRTRHATFVSHPFFPATWLSRYIVSLQLNSHFGLLRFSFLLVKASWSLLQLLPVVPSSEFHLQLNNASEVKLAFPQGWRLGSAGVQPKSRCSLEEGQAFLASNRYQTKGQFPFTQAGYGRVMTYDLHYIWSQELH